MGSLSSGYHPQSIGQTERANQTLESTLRCMAAWHPGSWSSFLSFSVRLTFPGFSLHWALALCSSLKERAITVPSVWANLPRCRAVWRELSPSLLQSLCSKQISPGLPYWFMVLPKGLAGPPTASRFLKLALCFVGPFEVMRMVNPTDVWLKLPTSMWVYVHGPADVPPRSRHGICQAGAEVPFSGGQRPAAAERLLGPPGKAR